MDAFCSRPRPSAADTRQGTELTIREALKWFDVKARVDEVSGWPVSRECLFLCVSVWDTMRGILCADVLGPRDGSPQCLWRKGGRGRISCMGLAARRRSVAYISWSHLFKMAKFLYSSVEQIHSVSIWRDQVRFFCP
ncbi:hypothetical protein CSUI_010533 [Cystoisospora suis]|uniref:Uncharacterized protein n=1 Tax=Cystoisospora suis TaxID=483139 RepID=A0A2C6KGY3_9APIC|nr:hypothetical protein CSUI_010533 [Cystoisospora suis]